jgi:hypothetical protein
LDASWNCCARCAYLYGNYSHEGNLIRWVCGCSDDEDTATARVSTTSSSPQLAPGVINNGSALVNVPFRLHSSLLPVSHPLVASSMCCWPSCKVQCVSFRKEHMTVPFQLFLLACSSSQEKTYYRISHNLLEATRFVPLNSVRYGLT